MTKKGDRKMLKKLRKYMHFDWEGFVENKKLVLLGIRDWKDFNTGRELGVKAECVIAMDKTDYGEAGVNNLYEKIIVKIPHKINIPIGKEIELRNVQAKVYGDYGNQLSVIAEDIQPVSTK